MKAAYAAIAVALLFAAIWFGLEIQRDNDEKIRNFRVEQLRRQGYSRSATPRDRALVFSIDSAVGAGASSSAIDSIIKRF